MHNKDIGKNIRALHVSTKSRSGFTRAVYRGFGTGIIFLISLIVSFRLDFHKIRKLNPGSRYKQANFVTRTIKNVKIVT